MTENKAMPTYKVFGHLGGLLLLELLFWAAVAGMVLVARNVAPNIDVHYPEHWIALCAAPVGLLLFAGHYRWKRKMMARWVEAETGRTIWPGARPRRSVTRFILWRTGIAFIGIALLDPVVGMRQEEVEAEGIDVMIALDVSKSMLTEDVGMDRLTLGKRTIERLMDRFDGDRVGLVVFAGDAFVQAPITMDLSAVSLFLDAIDTKSIPTQGTAIGWAIEECVRSFDPESEASRVIIVLTDGENHEDDAVKEALSAHQDGIQIHTIGMASDGGGPIPEFDIYGRQRGFKQGPDGQPVVSMLDEALLISIADAGDGTYTRAGSGYVNIDPVLQAIGALDGKATAKVVFTAFSHRFGGFIGLGLLMLLLEMAWPNVRIQRRRGSLAAMLILLFAVTPAFAQGDKAAAVAGSEAFLKGEFSTADSLFEQAGALASYESQLAMNRGHAQFRDGDSEGAIRSFQRAAQRAQEIDNPTLEADAWSNIGNCLAEGEEYAEAFEAFKQSLRLDHQDADTRHNLASMMQMLQQQEKEQKEDGEDGEKSEDESEDGEKDEDGEKSEDEGEDGEKDEGEDEDGEKDEDGEPQKEEQVAGQISAQDAARILESLERQEAVIRAKLQAQENAERRKAAGKSSIEKDW